MVEMLALELQFALDAFDCLRGLQFVTLAVECAGLDAGDEIYELFVDRDRRTGERAADPNNNAILGAVMRREQRAVSGRQTVWRRGAADIQAFDEVELPRR